MHDEFDELRFVWLAAVFFHSRAKTPPLAFVIHDMINMLLLLSSSKYQRQHAPYFHYIMIIIAR